MNTKLILLFLTFASILSVVSAHHHHHHHHKHHYSDSESETESESESKSDISLKDLYTLIEKSMKNNIQESLPKSENVKAAIQLTNENDDQDDDDDEVEISDKEDDDDDNGVLDDDDSIEVDDSDEEKDDENDAEPTVNVNLDELEGVKDSDEEEDEEENKEEDKGENEEENEEENKEENKEEDDVENKEENEVENKEENEVENKEENDVENKEENEEDNKEETEDIEEGQESDDEPEIPEEDNKLEVEKAKFQILGIEENDEDDGLDVGDDDENNKLGSVIYHMDKEEQDKIENENKEHGQNYYEIEEPEEIDGDLYIADVKESTYDENEEKLENDETPNEEAKKESNGVGVPLAIIGAFGVVAALGYKYTHKSKRILLPFEDSLEKGEFGEKSNEQQIIPVWAATKTSEENEDKDEKLYEVVFAYEPELPDELKLSVGDQLKINEIYEDGWGFGYNKTTQLYGTFPSTSLGDKFNINSVQQYASSDDNTEIVVEGGESVEELKKKIVESN